MILNLRGTSGTGKTTVARALLLKSSALPVYGPSRRKPEAYKGSLYGRPLVVLGSYETTCGGMDTVASVGEAAELIHKYTTPDNIVVYEGLMISHMYGTVGQAVERYGARHIFAFLDTPLEVALARVQARRDARGETRPFNPANTTKDWESVRRCRNNIVKMGRNVVDVPYKDSVEFTFKLIKKGVA